MITFSRTDRSVVGRWWWTVDRWTLLALGILISMGGILTLAASPGVAERIGLDQFHFVRRQIFFMMPAIALMLGISMLPPLWIRRVGTLSFLFFLMLMALTLVVGSEIKGAHRWIYLGGLSIQPSEFVKPTFAVVAAWIFAIGKKGFGVKAYAVSALVYGIVVGILLLQPDVGMALVVSSIWGAQFFVAGLPIALVLILAAFLMCGGIGAYFFLPHVTSRIDRFLNPQGGDNYQIDRAMEAFQEGGLFGRGPGEGAVKSVLPDAHTDFIFAVAGEEYGLFVCLLIVGLFAFIVLRCFARALGENNIFVMLAATGLVTQFGLQAIINMGVNLRLMPTKGMTLPFISYGGSSLLALALGMGMLLALTRWRPSTEDRL